MPSGSFTGKSRYLAVEATFECHAHHRRDDLPALGRERARAAAFSFAPLYQFLSAVAHLARMDERQAIVDLVREAREQGRGKS
jgi:hypothetical protein